MISFDNNKDNNNTHTAECNDPIIQEENHYSNNEVNIVDESKIIFKEINNVIFREAPILITDPNGFIIYVNDKCCATLGYQNWELIGKHAKIFKTGLHSVQFYQNLWGKLLSGEIWKGEISAKRKDNTFAWFFMSIFPLMDSNNHPSSFLTLRIDITEDKQREKQVLLQEKLLGIPFDEVVGSIDQGGNFKYLSPTVKNIYGYNPLEIIGENVFDYMNEEHRHRFNLWLEKLKGSLGSTDSIEVELKNKSGSWISCEITATNMLHDPIVNGIVFISREITQRKHLYAKMEKMEYCDHLTGLPNYKQLDECLGNEIKQAKENQTILVVAHLDLDDFKYVNDMFGRNTGNQLLIDFSARINDCLDGSHCLFRPGGDEFILVINNISDFDEANHLLSKIYSNINKEPFSMKGNEMHLSASMGVSIFPYSGETKEELLKNAETAMYRAKKNGKNQYQIFSPTMNLYNFKQFTLRNDSKKALINNEYIVEFQPRFNPMTNQMVSAEALIRWNHPKWGIVSPSEFISMAEDSGFIVQIGEWTIKRVCNQLKDWQSENIPVKKISINLSSLQLLQPNFLEMVSSTLREYSISPKWIEFEITETVIIQKEQQVLKTLKELRNLGITIALDDFGTGFSSLNYLSKFPCQIIKIDKSLIDNIHSDTDSYEIISSIIGLCHKLGKTVVAEGVETKEQLTLLKELKCDEIQGYFFSKPVTEQEFREYLRKSKWIKTNDAESQNKKNQRGYFRVKLKVPLLADMTIDQIGNKKLRLGSSQVFIENIGPGGLCFHSNLQLPVKKDIQLLFTTEIDFKELKLTGNIVWRKELNNTLLRYGVQFQINQRDQEELIKLLNSLQLKLRKSSTVPGCRFVTL